jgi:hypothetical protein
MPLGLRESKRNTDRSEYFGFTRRMSSGCMGLAQMFDQSMNTLQAIGLFVASSSGRNVYSTGQSSRGLSQDVCL